MVNIKFVIIPMACLLIATLVHASSKESSGELSGLGGIINNLPSTVKQLGDALPLKQISDALPLKQLVDALGADDGLVLTLVQLLITILALPLALVGAVLSLVVSLLGLVVGLVVTILKVL